MPPRYMSLVHLIVPMWLTVGCAARPAPVPAPDRDRDNIADSVDACPDEPEDYDGYLDGDGCPDYDNSEGFIEDVDDRCWIVRDCDPGFLDDDGCPDVVLTFATGSATLDQTSLRWIGELANELESRNKVAVLRIDGHAIAGEADDLAQRRATAVRDELIARGVSASALTIKMFTRTSSDAGFVSFFAVKCRSSEPE